MKFRRQKLGLFFQLIGGGSPGSLLDVGGGTGIAGEFSQLYNSFSRVSVVKLQAPKIDAPSNIHLHTILADGCNLPFRSGSFDWVFCNAVIEHVGGWERQELFANEIRRVAAKGYFVATPNKYFPIEPHTLLPFYQFLSVAVRRIVVRFSPGYLTEHREINLLSARNLRLLFPEAEVKKVGFRIFANNLVAFHRAK